MMTRSAGIQRILRLAIWTALILVSGCGKSDKQAQPAATSPDQQIGRATLLGSPLHDDVKLVREYVRAAERMDEIGLALIEIERLEDQADLAAASTRAEKLLPSIPQDDPRKTLLETSIQRLAAEANAAMEIGAALENLTAADASVQETTRAKILAAGTAGHVVLRKALRGTNDPTLKLAAVRLLRELEDDKAVPLFLEELGQHPPPPLQFELFAALSEVIQRHSREKLKLDLLMELLVTAEAKESPIDARLLRGIAAGWEFRELDRRLLGKLFDRVKGEPDASNRHLVGFLAIAMMKGADQDVGAFNRLLGGPGRVEELRKYVEKMQDSNDTRLKTWAEQIGPMLGMISLKGLKDGLFLYFDFNEPLYHPQYRDKRPYIWIRDQSGPEVTNQTPRTTLKGVLATDSRVPGIDGRGILFKPSGLIEFPQGQKFMKIMQGNYSYAAWIRPLSYPNAGMRRNYGVIIGKQGRNLGLKLHRDGIVFFTHQTQDQQVHNLKHGQALPTNKWHHVAGVVDSDGGRMLLFVDGRMVAETKFAAGMPGYPANDLVQGVIGGSLRIRRTYPTPADGVEGEVIETQEHYTFDGVIDEVRVYQKALTPDEVRDLYLAFAGNVPKANQAPLHAEDDSDKNTAIE